MTAVKDTFHSIQALRAVAAVMVLLFHTSPGHWFVGTAGVDIFFVISGFIMGSVGRGDSPANFIKKRLIRVVPLYWLITVAMCAASLVPGLFSTFTFDVARLAKSLLFIPFANAEGNLYPLMVVGWTLNYEMFFYALFALGLWVRKPMLLSFVVIALLAAAALVHKPESAIGQFYITPLMLEFAFGLGLSQGVRYVPRWLGPILIVAGIAALLLLGGLKTHGGVYRAFTWGIPAAMIVAGALAAEKSMGWPKLFQPLEYLGGASYSLYILHPIVVSLGHKVLSESLWSNLLIVAASIIGAILCFTIIEKPMTGALQKLLSRKSKPAPAGAEPAQPIATKKAGRRARLRI